MKFLVIGINHHTAPVAVRERVAFAPEALTHALRDIHAHDAVEEVVILSTCNRTEVYTYGDITPATLRHWLHDYHKTTSLPWQPENFYSHSNDRAVHHAMRVASGLDSLILGEPQILGQIKSTCAIARAAKTLGSRLEQLFQHTFTAAKEVRTQTAIGKNPVSIAYAAVRLARHMFAGLETKTALLIGAGKTIELTYRHLYENNIQRIIIANRTREHAVNIIRENSSRETNAEAISLGDVPHILDQVDIIVSSTASPLPILGKGTVEKALKKRRHRPVLMVDIAVPHDIEPEIAQLPDVYLYSVDDLQTVIQDNLNSRKKAAAAAEQIILKNFQHFLVKFRERAATHTLKIYRQQAEEIKNREIQRALHLISTGKPSDAVIHQLAHSLTNKLIHSPCVNIRRASSSGENEKMDWAKELLGLQLTKIEEP